MTNPNQHLAAGFIISAFQHVQCSLLGAPFYFRYKYYGAFILGPNSLTPKLNGICCHFINGHAGDVALNQPSPAQLAQL